MGKVLKEKSGYKAKVGVRANTVKKAVRDVKATYTPMRKENVKRNIDTIFSKHDQLLKDLS